MIQIDVLGKKGHEELKFEDAAAAKVKIDELLGKKYAVIAEIGSDSYKISSVDVETKEYITKTADNKRIPIEGTKVTAAPPEAGG